MTRERLKTKTRALDLDETPKGEQGLVSLIVETYKLNLAQNQAKRAYDKKRAELLGKMKSAKLSKKILEGIEISEGSQRITLEAIVDTPESERADVQKLSKLVDPKTFLLIVSATKKAIVDFAGSAVFEQCKETVRGTENVSVSLVKD